MAKSPHKDDASPLLKHENFVKFFLSTDCAVFVLHMIRTVHATVVFPARCSSSGYVKMTARAVRTGPTFSGPKVMHFSRSRDDDASSSLPVGPGRVKLVPGDRCGGPTMRPVVY
jgi:hypothetical protein